MAYARSLHSSDQCRICWNSFASLKKQKRKLTKLKCGHRYCCKCIKTYVKAHVSNANDTLMVWGYPRCPTSFCYVQIRNKKLFTKKLLGLVQKQLVLREQLLNNVRHCAVIGCDGTIHKIGKDHGCNMCGTIVCENCQEPKPNCAKDTIPKLQRHVCSRDDKKSLAQKSGFAKCPRCKTTIQRNGGCYMIFCVVCSVNFDYETGELYV